jgi:hypothetical protein
MQKPSPDLPLAADLPLEPQQLPRTWRFVEDAGKSTQEKETRTVVAALAAGDYHRRLHAGDSRKLEGDRGSDQQGIESEVRNGGRLLKFPANFRPSAMRWGR